MVKVPLGVSVFRGRIFSAWIQRAGESCHKAFGLELMISSDLSMGGRKLRHCFALPGTLNSSWYPASTSASCALVGKNGEVTFISQPIVCTWAWTWRRFLWLPDLSRKNEKSEACMSHCPCFPLRFLSAFVRSGLWSNASAMLADEMQMSLKAIEISKERFLAFHQNGWREYRCDLN